MGTISEDVACGCVRDDLAVAGLVEVGELHRNLPYAELVARSLARKEGILAGNGALVVTPAGAPAARPHDRFIVDVQSAADSSRLGRRSTSLAAAVFDRLLDKASAFLQHRESFVFDGFAGADPRYRLPISVVAEADVARALRAHAVPARRQASSCTSASRRRSRWSTAARSPPRHAPTALAPRRSSASTSSAVSC